MIDVSKYQEFLPVISGFLGGATSAGLFAGPIQTLQDWWEEELRNMFAKIIASSLDKRMSGVVHSAFVEIIKQLDVLDAMLLSYLKQNNHGVQSSIPTMKMVVNGENGTTTVFPLIFLSKEFGDFQQNAVSLVNLDRLGIITLKEDVFLSDETQYDFIKNHETISYILTEHPEMILEKSCFSLTSFGESFINACVV